MPKTFTPAPAADTKAVAMQLPRRGSSAKQRELQGKGGVELSEAVHDEIMAALEERL